MRGSLPWSRFHEVSQAIYFSVDNGADIINMSLGIEVAVVGSNGQEFMGLKSALQYAVDQGVVDLLVRNLEQVLLESSQILKNVVVPLKIFGIFKYSQAEVVLTPLFQRMVASA